MVGHEQVVIGQPQDHLGLGQLQRPVATGVGVAGALLQLQRSDAGIAERADGDLELAFFDAREDSSTSGEESRLVLSPYRRLLVTIPRGVWHAECNLGDSEVRVVNFPTIMYDHTNPDKYRLPLDTDEQPVRLGPDWQGW